MIPDALEADLTLLEDTLVQQFRALQKLVEVTHAERDLLLQNQHDHLQAVTEEKEAVLDQLSLLEDARRGQIQQLALALPAPASQVTSIQQILPYLPTACADRLARLTDGLLALVSQTRDLTYGNEALIRARLDWIRSFQAYLMNLSMPQEAYRSPLQQNLRVDGPAVSGRELRA